MPTYLQAWLRKFVLPSNNIGKRNILCNPSCKSPVVPRSSRLMSAMLYDARLILEVSVGLVQHIGYSSVLGYTR